MHMVMERRRRRTARTWLGHLLLGVFCVLCGGVLSADAQGRGLRGQPLAEPGVTPGEVQRMFDSYALMQAQDQLKISDEQFPQFLSRFKALQDARRRALQDHARIVQELRQFVLQPQPDEAQLKDRIKALADADARGAADVQKASDAVDQVLDVRQQAKFRVFEEAMERRKLELVTRARQGLRKPQ
jgi:Spy/CpxP family protein refolding chaperone